MNGISFLNSIAAHWSEFMWNGVLEAGLLLLVLVTVWFVLRNKLSVQVYYCLFLLVVLKPMIPVEVSVPQWLAYASPKHAASVSVQWVAEPIQSHVPLIQDTRPVPSGLRESGMVEGGSSSSTLLPHSSLRPVQLSPSMPSFTVQTVLMISWFGVVILLCIVWFYRHQTCQRLLFGIEELDINTLPVAFQDCLKNIGINQHITLYNSKRIVSPLAWGLITPSIVVPYQFFEIVTPNQARWVLYHELAHIKRKDLWVSFLQKLVQILFFFNPAVWIANFIVNRFREYACDDMALAVCDAPRKECGGVLINLAEQVYQMPQPVASTLGVLQPASMVKERLMRIMDHKRKIRSALSLRALVGICLLAAIVLPTVRAFETDNESFIMNIVDAVSGIDPGLYQISGIVMDQETQQPIPGAEVNLYKDGVWYDEEPTYSTTTQQDGTFTVDHVLAGAYRPCITAEDYVAYLPKRSGNTVLDPNYKVQVNSTNPHPKLSMSMDKGYQTTFTVLSPNGAIVPGAEVKVISSGVPFELSTVTNENGQCAIRVPGKTKSRAWVRHTHYGEVVSELFSLGEADSSNSIRVKMNPPGSVSGFLIYRDSGEPVKNHTMYIGNWERHNGLVGTRDGSKVTTQTDENGFYTFSNLGPYKYSINLHDNDVETDEVFDQYGDQVDLSAGEQYSGMDFKVGVHDTSAVLQLKLVSTIGDPVPGAEVIVNVEHDDPNSFIGKTYPVSITSGHAFSDENGLVTIDGLIPYKSHDLSIRAYGYYYDPPQSNDYNRYQYPKMDGIREIQLKPAGKISGMVLDENGDPLSGVIVSGNLDTSRMSRMEYAVSNEQGTFAIPSLYPGMYSLSVEADGYRKQVKSSVSVESGKDVQVQVRMDHGASIKGRVVDTVGNPIANASLHLKSKSKNPNANVIGFFQPTELVPSTQTEADGSYELKGIDPKGDVLVVTADGNGTLRKPLTADDMGETVDITLGQGATVTGKVFDAKGRPQSIAQVQIFNHPENLFTYIVPVNQDGSYKISGLPEGQFIILKRANSEFSLNDMERRTLTFAEGETYSVNFGTGETLSITGTVYGSDGNPLPDAFVMLESGQQFSGDTSLTTSSNQDGEYAFFDVPAGKYEIRYEILKPGQMNDFFYGGKGKRLVELTEENQPVRVDLSDQEYRLTLSMVDEETGEPISGVNIQTVYELNSDLPNEMRAYGKTDDKGVANIKVKMPGEYYLYGKKVGYELQTFHLSAVDEKDSEETPKQIALKRNHRVLTASVKLGDKPLSDGSPRFSIIWNQTVFGLEATPVQNSPGMYEVSGFPAEPVDIMVQYNSQDFKNNWGMYPETVSIPENQRYLKSFELIDMMHVQFMFSSLIENQLPEEITVFVPGYPNSSNLPVMSRNRNWISYQVPVDCEKVVIEMLGYKSMEINMEGFEKEEPANHTTIIKVDVNQYR